MKSRLNKLYCLDTKKYHTTGKVVKIFNHHMDKSQRGNEDNKKAIEYTAILYTHVIKSQPTPNCTCKLKHKRIVNPTEFRATVVSWRDSD